MRDMVSYYNDQSYYNSLEMVVVIIGLSFLVKRLTETVAKLFVRPKYFEIFSYVSDLHSICLRRDFISCKFNTIQRELTLPIDVHRMRLTPVLSSRYLSDYF